VAHFFAFGPERDVFGGRSWATIGFFEARGLAIIFGCLLIRAPAAPDRNAAVSVMFLLLQYFGPGMVNAVLTLRTGNAWVHAIGYHAIAPHAYIDAPNLVRIFGVR